MILLPLFLTSFVATILTARYLWLRHIRRCWRETCAIYANKLEHNAEAYEAYIEMWPMWQMLLNAHLWDFRRFIVNQEAYARVLVYFRDGVTVES